jgi:hypothetical protein
MLISLMDTCVRVFLCFMSDGVSLTRALIGGREDEHLLFVVSGL